MQPQWNAPDKTPPENGLYYGHLQIGRIGHYALIGYKDGIWVLGHSDAVLLAWAEIGEHKPMGQYETKGEAHEPFAQY